MALEDKDLNREFVNVTRVAQGGVPSSELSDEEMEERAVEFLRLMAERYDRLAPKIKKISDNMLVGRVVGGEPHARGRRELSRQYPRQLQ